MIGFVLMEKGEMMDDLISRQAAIDALEAKKDKSAKGDIGCFYNTIIQNNIDVLKGLPSAQPECTKRIIGKSNNGMTMWYQCESCNEPVDKKDLFCRECGRKFENE